jgi:serine/threonine protein kinase
MCIYWWEYTLTLSFWSNHLSHICVCVCLNYFESNVCLSLFVFHTFSINIYLWLLGSLDRLLYETDEYVLIEEKIELVRGIASGMLHLHKHNIVHRDLAARNILLNKSNEGILQPKISVLFRSLFFQFSFSLSLIFWEIFIIDILICVW